MPLDAAACVRRQDAQLGAAVAAVSTRHRLHADDKAVTPALGDESADIDVELARLVARPKLVAIAPGAIEAGAEQAMTAIGQLAERVERNLGAMCLAADHGRAESVTRGRCDGNQTCRRLWGILRPRSCAASSNLVCGGFSQSCSRRRTPTSVIPMPISDFDIQRLVIWNRS